MDLDLNLSLLRDILQPEELQIHMMHHPKAPPATSSIPRSWHISSNHVPRDAHALPLRDSASQELRELQTRRKMSNTSIAPRLVDLQDLTLCLHARWIAIPLCEPGPSLPHFCDRDTHRRNVLTAAKCSALGWNTAVPDVQAILRESVHRCNKKTTGPTNRTLSSVLHSRTIPSFVPRHQNHVATCQSCVLQHASGLAVQHFTLLSPSERGSETDLTWRRDRRQKSQSR